jgi:hypothetical protein
MTIGADIAYQSFRDFARAHSLEGAPKVVFCEDALTFGVGAEWGEIRKAVAVKFADDFFALRAKLEAWQPDGDCA